MVGEKPHKRTKKKDTPGLRPRWAVVAIGSVATYAACISGGVAAAITACAAVAVALHQILD